MKPRLKHPTYKPIKLIIFFIKSQPPLTNVGAHMHLYYRDRQVVDKT